MRFLLDANVVAPVGELLKRLGHEVESAYQVPVDIRNDRAIISWAHRNKFILLTHDRFRDMRTIEPVADELRRHGGRVLIIHGTPGQSPHESVGKMLIHFDAWSSLFRRRSGMVTVKRQNYTYKAPEDLVAILQKRLSIPREIEAAVKERKANRPGRKKSAKKTPIEQRRLA